MSLMKTLSLIWMLFESIQMELLDLIILEPLVHMKFIKICINILHLMLQIGLGEKLKHVLQVRVVQ